MQPIDMILIFYWDKKFKKELHGLEADLIPIREYRFDVSSLKDEFLLDLLLVTAITLVSVDWLVGWCDFMAYQILLVI